MSTLDAVTIAEAASALGVSKPRIHQMLGEGALTGPRVADVRSPAGAKRVWRTSLDEALQRRQQARRTAQARARARDAGPKPRTRRGWAPNAEPERSDDRAEEPMRAAAFRLKVTLDAARDALSAERAQAAKITKLLADTVAVLEEQQRLAQQAHDLAGGYADALTQLLGPSDPARM